MFNGPTLSALEPILNLNRITNIQTISVPVRGSLLVLVRYLLNDHVLRYVLNQIFIQQQSQLILLYLNDHTIIILIRVFLTFECNQIMYGLFIAQVIPLILIDLRFGVAEHQIDTPSFNPFGQVVRQYLHQLLVDMHDNARHALVHPVQDRDVVTHVELLGHPCTLHFDRCVEVGRVGGLDHHTGAVWLAGLHDAYQSLQISDDNFDSLVLLLDVFLDVFDRGQDFVK